MRAHRWLLLVLFFGSGACGLVYQVLWLRLLSLVFGVTVYAASTVLASFMAGLAVGAWLARRLVGDGAAGGRGALVVFAALELGVGLSALATPAGLRVAGGLYGPLHAMVPDSLGLLTLARFACAFAVLLVPTALMGATLPVLSSAPLVRGARFGSHLGGLYAVNTAGALCGALATGYVFIGGLGMHRTFLLAAAVNVAVAAGAFWLSRRPAAQEAASGQPALPPAPAVPGLTAGVRRATLVVMVVGGLAALALEIVWFRILVQFLAATSYAFTTMLATVLGGIAAGSALASRMLRRERDWVRVLALLQAATSVVALVSFWVLGVTYARGWRTSGLTQGSLVAILPAALLMGAAFPVAVRLWAAPLPGDASGPAEATRRVGTLYSANVLGAIAGAVLGGFVLLPGLGSRGSLIALAGLYLLSGLWLLWTRRPAPADWRAAGVLVTLFIALASLVPDPLDVSLRRRHGPDEQVAWREEGVQTSVSVHRHDDGRVLLYLDGLHQASDGADMIRLHRMIGHLPMVLHPRPARALVVGLGGGATPGAVTQYPGTQVDVVELSASVRRAAAFFAHVNYDVLRQPHVDLRVDDGRNFLAFTERRYDVVTADLIQPIHAGAGNLYSREYFELVKRVLAPGGLVMQWVGHRPAEQYKLIARTFLDAFPQTTLWFDGQLMVGSLGPLRLSSDLVDAKRADRTTAAALDAVGLDGFETLLSWYTAGPEELRAFVGDGLLLTDDRPLVEYHRSLASDAPVDLSTVRGDARRHLAQLPAAAR